MFVHVCVCVCMFEARRSSNSYWSKNLKYNNHAWMLEYAPLLGLTTIIHLEWLHLMKLIVSGHFKVMQTVSLNTSHSSPKKWKFCHYLKAPKGKWGLLCIFQIWRKQIVLLWCFYHTFMVLFVDCKMHCFVHVSYLCPTYGKKWVKYVVKHAQINSWDFL